MKINNTEIYGIYASMRGMRNPMNSWHLQDSIKYDDIIYYEDLSMISENCIIGEKDLDLAQRLIKAGPEHYKFLRQIQVWADFNMPLYWWKEMDLYKFKETNSCSTMHKITSRHLTLEDFEIDKELEANVKQEIILKENPIWKDIKGYEGLYQVSDDGRVKRVSTDRIANITVDGRGYSKKAITLNGETKQYSVHRLVAEAFIENPLNKSEVNHIDGNKLNNCVENLEWVTRSENMKHAHKNNLQHYSGYIQYSQRKKVGKFSEEDIEDIFKLKESGISNRKIAEKYNVSHTTIGSLINGESYKTIEMSDLDVLKLNIQRINNLIDLFNDTGDRRYFKRIIQMLPSSYKQLRTVNTNYAELRNIYFQRENHRLKEEWQDVFCKWVESLPYAEELILYK